MDNKDNNYEPNFILQKDPREAFRSKSNDSGSTQEGAGETASRSSASWHGGFQHSSRPETASFGATGADSHKPSANSGHVKTRSRDKSATVSFTRKSLVFLIVGCLCLSCLFGFVGSFLGNSLWNGSGSTTVSTGTASEETGASISTSGYNLQDATGSNMSIQEITASAQASVVEIKTEAVSSDSWMQEYVTEGAGSGVIVSKDGYLLTNNHVIEGANKITVTTANDKSYEAKLIGTDSTNDIAVLKVNATGLVPAVYGNSDQLKVGDLAVAIGNPLGELGGTVTAGIISAKDRELSIGGKTMKLLQTDSSINPGNSGGGLFNGDGQLVGIVVAKSSGSDVEGLGFAIPINTAANVAQQLMDNGYVKGQPWTGMTYTEGSSGFESLFGNSSSTVYIYSVDTTTAKLAGFEPGDVVFAVDNTQITSIDSLSEIITSHKVGDKLKFSIVRDGQTYDLTIKLQEKTKQQQ